MRNFTNNVLTVCVVMFFILNNSGVYAQQTIPEINLPGFTKSKILYSEDFSRGLKNWMIEGKVDGKIIRGKLHFESLDDIIENPKGNIWWKVNIQSPYILEFDYKSVTNHGLSMIFWNAEATNGDDVFSWKRTGKYTEYINDRLRAYHVSFHRFGSNLSNVRKAPGFHLISSVPDPIEINDTTTHRITIASTGNRQRIFVDGKLVHDFTDNGQSCISTTTWQHNLPCTGTGEIPVKGAIAIRHTQKQIAIYDNFVVYRLLNDNTKKK
jgi:hypothetical protein